MLIQRFSPLFTRNIVAQAEVRHQEFVIERSRSGRLWIVLAGIMLVPAFVASMIFFASALITPFWSLQLLPVPTNNAIALPAFFLLIVMNVALTVVVMLITLGLGANSISREKAGRTWEILLLTGVNARQVVWGKWWATVRVLWGDHLMVALLRFGLIGWFVVRFQSQLPELGATISPQVAQVAHLLALTTLISVYTLLDAGFTAVLGVMMPLAEWGSAITSAFVLAARVGATVLGGLWIWAMASLVLEHPGYSGFDLVTFSGANSYMLVGMVGLLLYALVIWGTLWLAQIVAIRGQASPPEAVRPQ
jgi:hypothetical protein